MIVPRLFLCGGVEAPRRSTNRKIIELDALGPNPNVTIRITDVAKIFQRDLPPRLIDLLEIAAYVYTADAGTSRGAEWAENSIESWGRDFKFVIPVRDLDFWSQPHVKELLQNTLLFVSDDLVEFEFRKIKAARRPMQDYLELGAESWPFTETPRVVLFSGGLDSLAGAVESAQSGAPLVLVSHRPVSTISARQKNLYKGLRTAYPGTPVLHVPIWLNKNQRFGHEPTQRTRSFLFASLGICVAEMVGADGVRFYENGVVSLNLPVADQVVGARASRTTHPRSLALFAELGALVTGRVFPVDNPFFYNTKLDVVDKIVAAGSGQLIGLSVSCAHTQFMTKTQPHCGTCSQCIDRRIAIIGGGHAEYDLASDYASDVFTGPRKAGPEQTIAVAYARHALELVRMPEAEFVANFNTEIARAVRGEPHADEAAERIYEMHARHGETVRRVISDQIALNADGIVQSSLDQTSMLALVAGRAHHQSAWTMYAQRLGDLLEAGVPKACHSVPAKNEPHLQEICDGILAGHDADLTREFPFMKWATINTKPDWSNKQHSLNVELKYVRQQSDIHQITEDIAADITKYSDNGKRTLFVVYDPKHLIKNEPSFSAPIISRPNLLLRIIR